MQKIVVVTIGVAAIIGILLFSVGNLLNSEAALYKDITTNDLQQKAKNQENFIVFMYQKNCASCKQVKPIINHYIETQKKDIYAIDINADENKNFLIQDLDIEGTPTVIFYKHGKEQSRFTSVFTENEFDQKAKRVWN